MDNGTRYAIERGDAKLELRESLEWNLSGGRVRASARLKSRLGQPIILFGGISCSQPAAPTFLLRDTAPGRNNAFRLDVRATHRNRKTDGREWKHQTHLHRFDELTGDAHAIAPPDPPWPTDTFDERTDLTSPGEIEQIFDDFCEMLFIKRLAGYRWVDPLALVPGHEPLVVDGDVIP